MYMYPNLCALPKSWRIKAHWGGVAWVEFATTSKLLGPVLPIPTSKKINQQSRHTGPVSLEYTWESTGSSETRTPL